jgi:hypothetical protein
VDITTEELTEKLHAECDQAHVARFFELAQAGASVVVQAAIRGSTSRTETAEESELAQAEASVIVQAAIVGAQSRTETAEEREAVDAESATIVTAHVNAHVARTEVKALFKHRSLFARHRTLTDKEKAMIDEIVEVLDVNKDGSLAEDEALCRSS